MTKFITALVATAIVATSCKRSPPAGGSGTVGPADGVQVWPGLEVATVGEIPKEWTAPWRNGTFFLKEDKLPGHAVRRLARCADLPGVAESDVMLGLEWERYSFREKLIRCGVMAEVLKARPARVSYVRDLLASDDPGDQLPAAVAPTAGGQSAAALSWRAIEPTLKFDRNGGRPGYHELIVDGAYRGRFTWWAAGDFDGDGAEDVVMFSNLAPSRNQNAPNVMRAFVLTRRQAGSPVTIVERFE